MTLESSLKGALDPKHFPRWAQACPKAFAQMQAVLLVAATKMHDGQLNLNRSQREAVTALIGNVAAQCWAAGQASVDEARSHGLDVKELK